jgi:hypothetical protein
VNVAEHRHKRSQLYKLLAALHAGPLGYALLDKIKSQATELLELSGLPETYPEPPADLYNWAYGFCQGNPDLGCGSNPPSTCLPAKLSQLSYSAGKGAVQRRLREVSYIEDEVVPCLDMLLSKMKVEAYRSILELTRQIVIADAQQIRHEPAIS